MTFLGWLSDPFKGLSDLQLGDEKGTLNHLEPQKILKITTGCGYLYLRWEVQAFVLVRETLPPLRVVGTAGFSGWQSFRVQLGWWFVWWPGLVTGFFSAKQK